MWRAAARESKSHNRPATNASRWADALKYAQERKISLDEFKVVFPTVEDKKTSEAMKEYKYPREFTGIIREAHLIGVFEDVKPHLDSIDKILKGEK